MLFIITSHYNPTLKLDGWIIIFSSIVWSCYIGFKTSEELDNKK